MVDQCTVGDYDALNTSDHVPIFVYIKCDVVKYSRNRREMYNWSKCDKNLYQSILDENLRRVNVSRLDDPTDIDNMLDWLKQQIHEKCSPNYQL